jgi:hypothetical protein
MKKIILTCLIIVSGIFLSSCGEVKNIETTVTKSGTLTMKSGEEYLLKTDEGIVNIMKFG